VKAAGRALRFLALRLLIMLTVAYLLASGLKLMFLR
jgi:hypothetical protein